MLINYLINVQQFVDMLSLKTLSDSESELDVSPNANKNGSSLQIKNNSINNTDFFLFLL